MDLPAASDSRDRRQVLQTQELSPVDWFFRRKVSMGCLENGPDGQQQHSTCVQDSTPAVWPRANKLGLSVANLSQVVGPVVMQGVSQAETMQFSAPTMLGQPDPGSPQTIAFEELGDSSVPLSPNCVQAGRSQEMPADRSLFGVSSDSPEFVMRPAGTTQRLPGAALPLPLVFDYVNDSFFGKPIAFAQVPEVPGSDGPMTLPVYTMPTGASLMMGQSSIPTVLLSGMSPRPVQWSTDTDRIDDATREGLFEAVASPMDTEDSPLVTTGLPGCPYRITSYAGPALADMNPAFGLQLHHARFLEFISVPESARRRFGWIGWAKSVPWQQRSTCRGTLALCYRICRFCHSSLRRYIGCRWR